MTVVLGLALAACSNNKEEQASEWNYSIDEFADIEVLRYQVPQWDSLSFNQKEYIYHLSEAAKAGRDITWDQYFKYNLDIRHALEAILENYKGDRSGEEWEGFLTYAKRVFFSNGIHHHYSDDKIIPTCSETYFGELMRAAGIGEEPGEFLLSVIYSPELYSVKRYQGSDKDIVEASAVNFYEGVNAEEVNAFYDRMAKPNDPHPLSYGLNSRVVKENGRLVEQIYKVDGLYGKAIEVIIGHLEAAAAVAENDLQKQYIAELIEYYRTGDLKMWDQYNVSWVGDTDSDVDFVNGFIEDYDDPLGRKATWEGIVNYRDREASKRTSTISENAQWFEDHSPVDPRFKKAEVKGVSAKVINVAVIAGGNYPATAIGINLPNADWIRKEHGSKSVTIANITEAYARATEQRPKSILTEFAWDEEEIEICRKYGTVTDDLHTDLHECLGHGSGQLLEGTPANALKEYTSCLEEARADLFALYYLADPKLVELGLLDSPDAYKAQYISQIRNGIMTQFCRIELGKQNTEAHMQDRKLIAQWCYEKGKADNVIEKKVRDGKTYFVINDFDALRSLFGELLSEIQRIKSEGDYQAGKALVEDYAIRIDYDLHKEVLERYSSLDLKPYRGFVNPDIVPVMKDGKVVDYSIEYCDDFLEQQLKYGRLYSTL
ncbi:MAG: dihydrofolate reductase [Bacteroidales bacterium]|nr:dihydrofolate reductase [Candidatus Cacconaster merdequi]